MSQSQDLETLFADVLASHEGGNSKLPPVEKWNPELSGDIDIRIARSGEWYHEGDLIRREALVRVFSSILKREGDDYFLVTPVEKWRIRVDDVPFQIVSLEVLEREQQQALVFTTSTGDQVVAGPRHPLRVEIDTATGEPSPYVLVRNGMEGLIARPVFYQLAELATRGEDEKKAVHGVYSLGCFFALE
ncbi:MAG: hypothetical protein VR73_05785 [Gammaproteobacteria bacterium BRH_c0]|nr:MAG: hypothetical protein VR73_05785 [Gammaproteobacteria bacterium BRH_c0]